MMCLEVLVLSTTLEREEDNLRQSALAKLRREDTVQERMVSIFP